MGFTARRMFIESKKNQNIAQKSKGTGSLIGLEALTSDQMHQWKLLHEDKGHFVSRKEEGFQQLSSRVLCMERQGYHLRSCHLPFWLSSLSCDHWEIVTETDLSLPHHQRVKIADLSWSSTFSLTDRPLSTVPSVCDHGGAFGVVVGVGECGNAIFGIQF